MTKLLLLTFSHNQRSFSLV